MEFDPTKPVQSVCLIRFPGYQFRSDGTIWSRRARGRHAGEFRKTLSQVKGGLNAKGYIVATLTDTNGRNRPHRVHRLILEAFVGPCPLGMQCRHKDGDRTNNSLSNLAWGTPKENTTDKFRHGTMLMGMQVATSRLTDSDVLKIKELQSGGLGHRKIAKLYGVSRSAIQAVCTGKSWKHLTHPDGSAICSGSLD